jgi:hypothetical protein
LLDKTKRGEIADMNQCLPSLSISKAFHSPLILP